VTRNVFVNADTGRTVEIRDDEAVRSFVSGAVDDFEPVDDGDGDGEQNAVYYVLVTDENGEVIERIPVAPGQGTTIVGPDDERVRDNGTSAATG